MTLRGFDVSHWQGTSSVDGAPDFVILKATGGDAGLYVDSDCDNKYQRAKSQGKLLGVYHFAGMTDPIREADFFVDNTEGYWTAREAILVLDNETHTNVGWSKAFMDRVTERTGVKPLIYMSASTIRAVDWSSLVQADYGLWVAGYPARFDVPNPQWANDVDMPYNIAPWGFAAIWQFTSSAGTLDRDIAMMSADAWSLYAGKLASTPPPTPVVTIKDVVITTAIPFDKNTVEDSTKEIGYKEVTQQGSDGVRTTIYTVTYTDDVETSRALKSDDITTQAVIEVTTVGTKPLPDPTPPTPPEPENPLFKIFQTIIKILIKIFGKRK